ncbi:MAG TPA: glycosyl transferase, partial [Parachlamydiales bacterium]|nr:glycosyl transferase [Parachlamydiales bacterium]
MKTICLNMIVKNESRIIERCLLSLKHMISYWVIADTGSSDGTQQKILACLQNIPGELLERPWVDFSYNRNEVLLASQKKGDYLLFIDADEWLFFSSPFNASSLQSDCYTIKAQGKTSEFLKTFLVTNALNWTWHGVIHESLVCSFPTAREHFSAALLIYDENTGQRA